MSKFILFLICLCASNAYGCQCFLQPFEQELAASKYIFKGLVVRENGYSFTFKILESWKGNFQVDTFMVTQRTSCERGQFVKGLTYIVYTSTNSIYNSSRTRELKKTFDQELLDLIFKNIGDARSIFSECLTASQEAYVKAKADNGQMAAPYDLSQRKVGYAVNKHLIKKMDFLEIISSSGFTVREIDTNGYDLLLWAGTDRNFRKIKRQLKLE